MAKHPNLIGYIVLCGHSTVWSLVCCFLSNKEDSWAVLSPKQQQKVKQLLWMVKKGTVKRIGWNILCSWMLPLTLKMLLSENSACPSWDLITALQQHLISLLNRVTSCVFAVLLNWSTLEVSLDFLILFLWVQNREGREVCIWCHL